SLTRTPNDPSLVSPKVTGTTLAFRSMSNTNSHALPRSWRWMVRVSSRILAPSAVRHSFFVLTAAACLPCVGVWTSVQTIWPCPLASDQKSTPLTPLILSLSGRPSGMTSPWQNQADFWWGWSVEPPGLAGSIGQARVTVTPPGALSGQRYGLATV